MKGDTVSRGFREGYSTPPDEDVAELSLLVPGWQLRALMDAAQRRGQTIGQVLRRFLHQFLSHDQRQGSHF